MTPPEAQVPVSRVLVEVGDGAVEVFRGGVQDPSPIVGAAHPAEAFGPGTVELLAEVAGTEVVCLNPRGIGDSSPPQDRSLLAMVDDFEAVRLQLGLAPWVFWGMSGGGWLALLYANRHPSGLAGIVVESACLCFRARLADPDCVLSPFFPAWRSGLDAAGLLALDAHTQPVEPADTAWTEVEGVGAVFHRQGGPALLVSPGPLGAEMKQAMPVLYTFDARSWAASIQVPTLVLGGSADPVVPVRHTRAVHEAIPGSRFLLVEGAGHVPTAARRAEVGFAFQRFIGSLTGCASACNAGEGSSF